MQTARPVPHHLLTFLAYVLVALAGPALPCRADAAGDRAGPEPAEAFTSDFEIMQRYGADMHKAVAALLESLGSPEPSVRRAAAFSLGELGAEAAGAVNQLARAMLRDPDIEVRTSAVFALGEIGPPALPVLMQNLDADDPRIRRSIASALVRIGKPAVPELIPLLDHADPILRRNAVGILGRIGPPAAPALPFLERALEDEDKAFCWTAKQAIRKINLEEQSDAAAEPDSSPMGAPAAVEEMPWPGADNASAAVPALIEHFADTRPAVRLRAVRALMAIGRPALAGLQQALGSPDADIRKNAAYCLGEMGPTAAPAAPALRQLLNDDHAAVRWCADNALKKINPAGN
jgi:HEAT repeat protein